MRVRDVFYIIETKQLILLGYKIMVRFAYCLFIVIQILLVFCLGD